MDLNPQGFVLRQTVLVLWDPALFIDLAGATAGVGGNARCSLAIMSKKLVK